MKYDPGRLLFTVDLAGTLLFGIEGALAAIGNNLDLLGLMVLGRLSNGPLGSGGIIRDVFIGAVPPEFSSRLALFCDGLYRRRHNFLFAQVYSRNTGHSVDCPRCRRPGIVCCRRHGKSASVQKCTRLSAVLPGTITGVGGGTVKKILLARIPLVLRADVYAPPPWRDQRP